MTSTDDTQRLAGRGAAVRSRAWNAVLFDVDGTLIDSNGAHARAWTDALRDHGIAADVDRVRGLIGMGSDKLIPIVAGVSETSEAGRAVVRRKKELFARLLPQLQPTKGARALLSLLREAGITLAIATSAGDKELQDLLAQAGLEGLIPTRTSKDDAGNSKPEPDIVHAALAKAGASRDRTLLVGDTPYDIEAAHRAGIVSIALRCGGHWQDGALAEALAIYDDPQDVLAHWTSDQRRLFSPSV
jgi:HAD superfamily hydrolase (TIGR01509 family)